MPTYISSQRGIDPAIVKSKRETKDYAAQFVSVRIEGKPYRVVVDGHHSIAAAKADGRRVQWEAAHDEVQREATAMQKRGEIGDWMAQHQDDSDWYDVETGRDVW